jgi:hypothetical protein
MCPLIFVYPVGRFASSYGVFIIRASLFQAERVGSHPTSCFYYFTQLDVAKFLFLIFSYCDI